MKTNVKMTVFMGSCILSALLVGLLLGWHLNSSRAAGTQDWADRGAKETRPQLTQKMNRADLGRGVSLTEVVGESDNGEVWLRACTIARNGERLMMKCWEKAAGGDNRGETVVQSYWRNGKVVLSEGNAHAEGVLLLLFDDAELPIQALEVKNEARLVPLSSERVKKMREDWKLGNEIMKPLIEGAKKGVNQQEGQSLIKDAVKKAKSGEFRGRGSSGAGIPGTPYMDSGDANHGFRGFRGRHT